MQTRSSHRSAGTLALTALITGCAGVGIDTVPSRSPIILEDRASEVDVTPGTQLRYRIDLGRIPREQHDATASSVRDAMRQRVNALGVSEPTVTPSMLNGQYYITVALPDTKDTRANIDKVNRVALLEFKERRTTLTEAEIREDADHNAAKRALAAKTAARARREDFTSLLAELNETNPYGRGGTFEGKKRDDLYEDQKALVFEDLQPGQTSGMHEVRITMQTGDTSREVTTGYSVVKLLERKDVTEERRTPAKATVTQLLVQYVGLPDAPIAITRSKEDARKLAEELLGRARAGEDFRTLIQAHSDDTTKEFNQGLFTDIPFGEADPSKNGFKSVPHDAALAAGEVGAFIGPVDTEYGFFVIRMDAKTEATDESTTEQEVSFQEVFFTTRVPSDWRSTGLSGKQFRSAVAQPIAGSFAGYEIAITFDEEGATLLGALTKRNVNKPIGIFLDDVLISAPTVESEITSGQAVITGDFTAEEANALTALLSTSVLAAPIVLVDQRSLD